VTTPLDEFARRTVLNIAEKALVQSGAAGVLPTPVESLMQWAGIDEVIDISQLPGGIPELRKPALWKRILGAIWFPARIVFIDRASSPEPRERWIKLHETTHKIVPWHEASALLDNERRLFRETEEAREAEANLGAAHLLFQGHRFLERVLDERCCLATPIAVAGEFGASCHATIRYFAENHPEPVALLITGRMRRTNGRLPIYTATQSPAFHRRFGPIDMHFPVAKGLPATHGLGYDELAETLNRALLSIAQECTTIALPDLDKTSVKMNAEAFFNGHNLFTLFTPHTIIPQSPKIRIIRRSA
jgi:hypothetical protein